MTRTLSSCQYALNVMLLLNPHHPVIFGACCRVVHNALHIFVQAIAQVLGAGYFRRVHLCGITSSCMNVTPATTSSDVEQRSRMLQVGLNKFKPKVSQLLHFRLRRIACHYLQLRRFISDVQQPLYGPEPGRSRCAHNQDLGVAGAVDGVTCHICQAPDECHQ